MAISSGSSRPSRPVSAATFFERALVAATSPDAVTTSASRVTRAKLLRPQVLQQRRSQLLGRLFGLVVAGVDRLAAQLAGHPWPPDLLRVAVDVEVVLGRGEQQHRAHDPAAGGPIGLLVLAIDAQPRAVVLEHAVHHGR